MNKRVAFVALLFVLPTSLASPVMGESRGTSGRVTDGMCELYDPSAGGGVLTVPSGECAVYDADEYAVGTVLEMTFDVSSTQIWDLLIFEESDYTIAYKGGQSNYPMLQQNMQRLCSASHGLLTHSGGRPHRVEAITTCVIG